MKNVGSVSLQQIETNSQRKTDKARVDHELKVMILDLESRPPRSRPVTVCSSKKDRDQENSYEIHLLPEVQADSSIICQQQTEQTWKPSVNDRMTESRKPSVGVRKHKALEKGHTTPASSTRTEFDIVTPKNEDLGGLEDAGAAGGRLTSPAVDGPGSPHSGQKGKVIYTELQMTGGTV